MPSEMRYLECLRKTHMPKLTAEIIAAAIEGFESQKRRIDDQIADLRAMLPGGSAVTATSAVTPEAPPRKRRKMSAAGRKAIAEAQWKRWAAVKGQAETVTPEPAKPKRKLSAAGRRAISEATKKRWAAKRAEAKSAAAKRTAPARRKAAVKTAPAKAAKRAFKKAAATKRIAPPPAPTVTEAAAQ
jgi:DNA-binding protein HU-beta